MQNVAFSSFWNYFRRMIKKIIKWKKIANSMQTLSVWELNFIFIHRVLWPPFSIHMEVIFSQIFHFFAVVHFALACRKYACYWSVNKHEQVRRALYFFCHFNVYLVVIYVIPWAVSKRNIINTLPWRKRRIRRRW